MRITGTAVLITAVIASGCTDATPPIRNPVVHDVTLVTTSFTDDFDSYGIKKTTTRNDTGSVMLIIDLKTWGSQFQPGGPCGVVNGRIAVTSGSVNGKFEPEYEGGPTFTMNGSADSTGAMLGSWDCRTRSQGPHYYAYHGTFTLKRRP